MHKLFFFQKKKNRKKYVCLLYLKFSDLLLINLETVHFIMQLCSYIFQALAGENQAELFSGQAHHFDTRRMNTPLIHDSFSTEARVPDVNTHLECNEVVQDWDVGEVNDGVDSLKNRSVSSLKSQPVPETDGPQFYDDVTPPNSPVANHEDEKGNLLHFHNEYVNHLLNLWRESSEYNVLAESTHVELDQFEYSNRWNAHSDQEFAASQGSISSGNGSQESDDISMEEGDSASSPEFTQPSSNMFSFTSSESGSRSNSPLNLRTPGPYDRLRSVSPRIMRSPSPVFPVHRLLRSPSPNWEELQANLSDLTPQDLLLFADERYSVRSRSPHSVSDQEVPDIEMDVQSFYSDSDDYYSSSMNRVRTAQSCDDQVVPEMIEE